MKQAELMNILPRGLRELFFRTQVVEGEPVVEEVVEEVAEVVEEEAVEAQVLPSAETEAIVSAAVAAAKVWFDNRENKNGRYAQGGKTVLELMTYEVLETEAFRQLDLFIHIRIAQVLATQLPKEPLLPEFIQTETHQIIVAFLHAVFMTHLERRHDETSDPVEIGLAVVKQIYKESQMPKYYLDAVFGKEQIVEKEPTNYVFGFPTDLNESATQAD